MSVSAGLPSKGVALAAHYTYRERTANTQTQGEASVRSVLLYIIIICMALSIISYRSVAGSETDACFAVCSDSRDSSSSVFLDCVMQFERSQTMQTTDTVMTWYSCFFWTHLSSSAIFVSFSPRCLLIAINCMKQYRHCQSTDELYL